MKTELHAVLDDQRIKIETQIASLERELTELKLLVRAVKKALETIDSATPGGAADDRQN